MLAAAHDDDELDRVFQTLQSSDSELAARAALRVFSRLRGWDAVPAILLAGTRDEHELRDRAAQYAATWMRRHGTYGWTMPVSATQARLVLALDALGRSSHPVPRQYADSWASLVEWAARVCGGKPSDR